MRDTDKSPESRPLCPSLASIFTAFLRLGATSFGGPAMIAYIRRMAVEQRRWLDDATFRDGVALCQTVPGATAMQVAAYVGLRARGISGAACAYIGFALPAFLIMMALSAFYIQTQTIPASIAVFSGLRAIIVAIIANSAITFGRNYLKHGRDIAIAAAAAGAFILGVNPILVILLAGLAGLVAFRDVRLPTRPGARAGVQSNLKPLLMISAFSAAAFALLFIFYRGLFDLAALMLRIDLFAFGGGFASIPLMLHEFVDVRSWMDSQTFMNGIALGQITPGPIVITATFVGYMLYGPIGGIVATFGIFLPSFLVVIAAVPYYDRLSSSVWFNRAVGGIFCSFVGLLASAAFHFAQDMPWDMPKALIALAALAALLKKVDILWVVLIGIAVSVLML